MVHQELVQDVFVKVYLGLGGFRAKAPFVHWLRRIATHTGYRHWKRAGRDDARRAELEPWMHDRLAVSSPVEPSEAAEILYRLMAVLPAEERLVLTLLYLEECSTQEIAERTGWSRANVKVRAFRARRRLKNILETHQQGNLDP